MEQVSVAGFEFKVKQASDSTSFYGTAKVNGQVYFATIKVTRREDGTPKIGIADYRVETFYGRNLRGKANVKLEEMMCDAKEFALAYVA